MTGSTNSDPRDPQRDCANGVTEGRLKSAALLLSHVYDNGVRGLFRSLSRASGPEMRAFFLADNTRCIFDRFEGDSDYALFAQSDLRDLGYPGKSPTEPNRSHAHRNMPLGYTELPLLWFFRKRPDYDYYWVIEYDVRFSGKWSRLFNYFEGSSADLLCTTLMRFDERPDWPWWKSLDLRNLPIEQGSYLCGFFPVYRISRGALQRLDDLYGSGVAGHYECLVPTLLSWSKMTLEDIGGDGPFVKPENRNRFYTNDRTSYSLSPGSFVFRPPRRWAGLARNRLWHPVKHASILGSVTNKLRLVRDR